MGKIRHEDYDRHGVIAVAALVLHGMYTVKRGEQIGPNEIKQAVQVAENLLIEVDARADAYEEQARIAAEIEQQKAGNGSPA